jgi:hypothetical protein
MIRRLLGLVLALAVLVGGIAPLTAASSDSTGKAGISNLDGKKKNGKRKNGKRHGKKHGKKKHGKRKHGK